jgi:hypothetical protein
MTDAKQFIFKIETRADKHQRRRRKTGDNREEESPERSSSDEENAGKVNRDKTSKDKRVPDEYDDDDDNPPKPKRQVHLLKLFLYKMIQSFHLRVPRNVVSLNLIKFCLFLELCWNTSICFTRNFNCLRVK